MKRSSMLRLFSNFLYEHGLEPEEAEEEAETLLNIVEEAGMVPPKIELGDSGFVNTIEILNYSELDYTIKWEDEE